MDFIESAFAFIPAISIIKRGEPGVKDVCLQPGLTSNRWPVNVLDGQGRLGGTFARSFAWPFLLVLVLVGSGCEQAEIRVYRAPKDEVLTPKMAVASAHSEPARPQLAWRLPAGWQESPGDDISLKNFVITGPGNTEAHVSITRLGNLAGKDALLVNMWRQQTGLEPLPEADALKAVQPVDFAAGKGSLFEVWGTNHDEAFGIITAFAHRADGSWFCKLSGGAQLVTAQKPAFIEFLKSLKFDASTPAESPVTTSASQFQWKVPEQWKGVAPGEMQVARFAVPGPGDAAAEVFVSVFDTDTGGTLANVNRWRRQIGLSSIEEKDLASLVSPLDPALPGSVRVDLSNGDKRLVGVVVRRGEKFWFYKLLGHPAAVAPANESYLAFAKSQP